MIVREEFDRCVSNHPMPRACRSFTAKDQFLCMVFRAARLRGKLVRHRGLPRIASQIAPRGGYSRNGYASQPRVCQPIRPCVSNKA
ncbi:DUF4372 domain-containing protein [Pelagicoccus mobilis]|uniref:DUF4372 domain-containing protein n=1 Tax=Pelagicoccus mobilis TaxID=415221 RepID=UPI00366DC9F5